MADMTTRMMIGWHPDFSVRRPVNPDIPLGCICSYTWHPACDGRIVRNGALLSCRADHSLVDEAARR